MSLPVPFALFGWLPLTIFFFLILKPHQAVLFSVIGGILFLPMAGYDLPGIPPFTKNTAIAIGLILGGRISGQRQAASFRWNRNDLPMLIWVFCPIATSLANSLGLYDGIAGAWENIMIWGIPYLAGRVYFDSTNKLRELCIAIIIGGLLYVPLCLYEIRMSPQLSNIVYNLFPHSFFQHMRYGGFRPIVFMQHGLMVALWMAITTTTAFWFWRSGELNRIMGIPMTLVVVALATTTVLCKSANGWFALFVGFFGYFLCNILKSVRPLYFLLLIVPLYILLRTNGVVSESELEAAVSYVLDADRVSSLSVRIQQEDLFIEKTLQKPLLGWGGYERGWPVDPNTGKKMIEMIDSLWLIVFNTRGVLGIFSFVAGMLITPWIILRSFRKETITLDFSMLGPCLLSGLVILFMIDSLMNSMVNSIYVLISGALAGWYSTKSRATI